LKRKLLVVDDEPQIRKQLKIGLEGHGYEVVTASHGVEADRFPWCGSDDTDSPAATGCHCAGYIARYAAGRP